MAWNRSVIAIAFLISSGCAFLSPGMERQNTEEHISPVLAADELDIAAAPSEAGSNRAGEPSPSGTPSRAEIRQLQIQLKAAGFDPGPIDGIMGARTKAALLRLKSGCAALIDFPPALGRMIQTTDKAGAIVPAVATAKAAATAATPLNSKKDESRRKVSVTGDKTPSIEDVRRIQAQLKDSGFDPGPIDGIMGPQTKLALQRSQTSRALTKSATASAGRERMFQY